MDCNEAEEQIEPYLLGVLDAKEMRAVESHLDTCESCSVKLQQDGETLARLAFIAPEQQVPPHVKHLLFDRIAASENVPSRIWRAIMETRNSMTRGLVANTGRAMLTVTVVALIFGGLWFNVRLGELSKTNQQISVQMETVVDKNEQQDHQIEVVSDAEAAVTEMIRGQRVLIYEVLEMSARPGRSVSMLWGSGWTANARGMMVSGTGNEALLLTLDLPPLRGDQVYQVWLIKDGLRYSAGTFTVDSTGYGQAVIIPVAPLAEFDAIGITVEPSEGSEGPTGTSVLKGDL